MPSGRNRPDQYYSTLAASRRNQSTRTVIEQWRNRWGDHTVYCVDHDAVRPVRNITDQRWMASHPAHWCPDCQLIPSRRPEVPKVPKLRKTTPRGIDRPFGVEIECIRNDDHPDFEEVAAWIEHDTGITCTGGYVTRSKRYLNWRVKDDGSLCDDYGYEEGGYEIVSPPLSGEDGIDQVRRVFKSLRDHDFKINDGCGLHIHLEARDLNVDQCAAFAHAWHDNQALIDWLVEANRRQVNYPEYCSPITNQMLADIERASSKRGLAWTCSDRYFAVNLSSLTSHGTLEVRQHHGTLSHAEFEGWLRFSVGIIDAICAKGAKLSKSVGVRSLLNALPMDDETKAFLIGRALMRAGAIQTGAWSNADIAAIAA